MNPRVRLSIGCVVLASCASGPQWDKPGVTPESLAADLKQCELSAPIAPRTPAGPRTTRGPGIDLGQVVEREGERMRKDERYVDECMRAKGYRAP